MKIPQYFALILCVFLSSCERNSYSDSEVQIQAEGYTDKGVELQFVVPSESGYYCPGLDLDYDGEKVKYSYVRSRAGQSPKVDAKAEERDGVLAVTVPFASGQKSMELIDSSGKSLGKWQQTSP